MSQSENLHFISAIFIFFSAIVPLYLGINLKKNLKILTIALSGFIIIHGIYHILGYLGFEYLSKNIFEPLSLAALNCFGVLYLSTRLKQVVKT